jgi:signal transduction histidine kinase/type II secretory pathway pseudopilin PulG
VDSERVKPDSADTQFFVARPAPELGSQRENIRRSFLRANTAVAIILIAVLGLALAALLASLRATRHQQLAEQAQLAARTELWRTYLSKSRAARLGSALDRRQECMQSIARAAAMQPSPELRDEAIAGLALMDFALEKSWPLTEEATTEAFDRPLQQYAVGMTNGDIVVRRVSDNQVVQWLRETNGEVPRTQGAAIGLEFSPGGEQLAARYEKGGAAVWDVASGKLVFSHAVDRERGPLSRPRFTSDGRFLVCMSAVPPEGVTVFDIATRQRVAEFPQFKRWLHAAPRPGKTMFSVNTDSNVVHVLDWRTGQTNMSFPFPAGVERMAWSPDGKYLALGGNTVDVHLWDVETGQRRILTGHTADVRHLTFDPRGECLASASSDGTSRVWETGTGRLLGVTDRGFAEQFGEDHRLALSRFKGAVEVWSLRPSPVHRMYVGPGSVEDSTWALDLSPDGRWLASLIVDQSLVIWDLLQGTTPGRFEMAGTHLLGFHPARPELYLTTPYKTVVRKLTFVPATGAPAPRLGEPTYVSMPTNFFPNWITLSRNGRTMALGALFDGRTYVTNIGGSGQVVWLKDLVHLTRSEVGCPAASASGGGSLALSGDGRWAACGFLYPHGTKVWDTQSGNCIMTLSTENSVVEFSPDDRWLVTGDRSHFGLFRSGDWQEVWRMPREGALYSAGPCAFSPDGKQLAVAKSRQMAAILDASTGRELAQLTAPRPATIKVIRWSRDGRRLVMGTAENLVQVWELDALRNELASLGLNWDAPAAVVASMAASVASTPAGGRAGIVGALVLGSMTAGVVTFVALLALRRHRRLMEDFARTEALAGQRERELQVEREVGRLKSSFVSMVSHEFRTPLGVIRAAGENLGRYFQRLTETQRAELLGDIAASASRMNDLIEEVLLLGKVESGKMECRPAPVDLPALCRRVIAEVRMATHEVCPIELAGTDATPGVKLDEGLVVIVLSNLLSNAVKYSQPGQPVWLEVRQDAGHVVVDVRDEGIGIPESDQAQLFHSFRRAANVGVIPGSGLGLTIVKRCVELHRGGITFTSAEGRGTTFTVRLPT